MKILLVSSFLPYPLFSGGHIRLFNIIKQLSKKHQIYLVCEKRDYQTKDDIKKVEEYCKKVITVNRKKQWSWQNIVKTGLWSKPFLITGHTNNKMKKEIDDLLNQEKPDFIHVETFYVMQNLPETKLPIVLVEHNVEYLVYSRFAKTAPFFLKPFLYFDILKLKLWEEGIWKKATKLIAVSEIDKKIMEKKKRDVDVVSNGVDLEKFKVHPDSIGTRFKVIKGERWVLFIGDFRWMENRDAAKWILREIWPKIKLSDDIFVKLWIVGRKIPDDIKSQGYESVIFDENAALDTSVIYQKADVLLAPIRVGGGTSFKILEAMASGVPVVTTSLGNEGIGAKDRYEILLANSSLDFAKKIIDILQDEKLYIKIAVNARKLIEKKYDWEKIVGKLEEVYEAAVINVRLSS